MAVTNTGPLNVRLFLNSDTGEYDYQISDFRVSVESRRKIAKAAEHMTNFYDSCFRERLLDVFVSIVRLVVVSIIIGWLIATLIPAWWLSVIMMVIMVSITAPLALLKYDAANKKAARKILKEQRAIEMELAVMLRKDLDRSRQRQQATKKTNFN